MNLVDLLNTAFAAATDAGFNYTSPTFDYKSMALWELNLIDSVEKPQICWARPFNAIDSYTKTGIKITKVVAQVFFLKFNKFSDTQSETEPIISAMLDAMKIFYFKFMYDTTLQPNIKTIRYEDVYKFLDINYSGISSFVEFEFTNELC